MKRLLIIALALVIAGGAMAEDTFGLWRMVDGEYVNYIPAEEVTLPFDLFVTIHSPTSFSIGGYEVGITINDPTLLVLAASGPNGWTNFGDNLNHLVGFQTPLIVQDEIGVLCTMQMLGTTIPAEASHIVFGPSVPSSFDHDGPGYADGVNPDVLVPCGYVNGSPDVFLYGGVVGVEAQTLSGVKALFD